MLDAKILKALRHHPGGHVSGEDICRLADVSRAAVWKHIEKLRSDGYEIEASPHLGYRLVRAPDSLIPDEIRWQLKAKILGREIIAYRAVDSTNDAAYRLAEQGSKEGLVVVSEEQHKGKGRHGRRWVSPAKGGIYLSCVLRPKMPPHEIPRITLLAAVAVAQSIREACGLEAMIKWPNDILVNGKKVCGILTEMKAEQDAITFVVIGIGINVTTPTRSLPPHASSLKQESPHAKAGELPTRPELARIVLEHLDAEYLTMRAEGFGRIIEAWKSLTDMLGSTVRVTLPNRVLQGQVYDIDADGSLMVRLESGIIEKVSAGDVERVR